MYFFDLDGTITDSNGLWLDVDVIFAQRRRLEVTKEYTDFVAHAIFPTAADFTKEYYHLPDTPQEIMDEWLELAYDQYANQVPAKPGAVEFLEHCRRRGERMAMITASVPELCRAALSRLGLEDYFEFILFAQELGLEKRSPQVYLTAAAQAGVTPEVCTLFDDSPVACAAAQSVGMKTVGVHDGLYAVHEQEMRCSCGRYIYSFEELLPRAF